MHNVVAVHEIKSKQYLLDDACSLRFIECRTFRDYPAHQISASHEFLDDVVVFLVLHQFEYAHNVCVRDRLNDLKLVPVQLPPPLVMETRLRDDFDGYRHLRANVHTRVNRTEATCPKFVYPLVLLIEVLHTLELHFLFEGQKVLLNVCTLGTAWTLVKFDSHLIFGLFCSKDGRLGYVKVLNIDAKVTILLLVFHAVCIQVGGESVKLWLGRLSCSRLRLRLSLLLLNHGREKAKVLFSLFIHLVDFWVSWHVPSMPLLSFLRTLILHVALRLRLFSLHFFRQAFPITLFN